jgi:endonuclease/exonuclease/phosphatase (EEP) superfamily protein YafD
MAQATFHQRLAVRFKSLTALFGIATLCATLATQHWFLELFSHFAPHYFVFALFCTLGLVWLRIWRWAVAACALVFWNGYPVARALLQERASPAVVSQQFTVFHFNVGLNHEQPQRIVSFLQRRANDIDVVVLLEAGDEFGTALDELKELFPHQIRRLENSPFGIAMASRHALEAAAVSLLPSPLFPHIEATLRLPGRATALAIYAVHAPPPISGEMAEARNSKLDHIARLAARQAQSTPIVVGDFNLTPWSPYFRRFVAASGLRDARTPYRFDHTWPVTFDNASIGIAVDHSFAHPSLPLLKRTIGPDLGSDHMPVTVTFGY